MVGSGLRTVSRGSVNSSKLSAPSPPVQCTGTPMASCSSQTTTLNPSCARRHAAYRPPGPPPTMSASYVIGCDIIASSFSNLSAALFPFPTSGDPERQQQELEIETDARPFEIETIEAEFARARQISRRVHLRQARQARADAVPIFIAADVLERD